MRPSYHPEGLYDESKANAASSGDGERPMVQLWHRNGRCAPGTVPVRRTKKDDLLRASSMRRYGRKHKPTVANPMSVDLAMLNEGGHQVRARIASIYSTQCLSGSKEEEMPLTSAVYEV